MLAIEPKSPPLQIDQDGTVRVAGTRVTLDTVVGTYQSGGSPEQIALQFPSVSLADVYAVIAYYLIHQVEVEQYMARRGQEASELRREIETHLDPKGIRDRLLARQARGAP